MNTKPLSGKPKEINARLQRGVLRLALSFHGQHPELDKHLKELGTLIRNGKKDDELQNLIDEIVDTIVSRGITQNTEQRGGRSLSDLLHRIEVSEIECSRENSTRTFFAAGQTKFRGCARKRSAAHRGSRAKSD